MAEDKKGYISQNIVMLVNTGQRGALPDAFDVQDVIEYYAELKDLVDYYKKLKKDRNEKIDMTINKLELQMDTCKDIIDNTFKKFNIEKMPFPGIGVASHRTSAGSYSFDNDQMLTYIEENVPNTEQDKYIRVKKEIAVGETKKLLERLAKTDKLPEFVTKDADKESIVIRLDKGTEASDEDSISSIFGRATNPTPIVNANNEPIDDDRLFDEL